MVKQVAIVSLSRGILGEPFMKHELKIGLERLEHYGLNVKFMDHALCGLEYLNTHPEARAADLLQAFRDPDVDMILCAIGGDDTYRLLPYLFDHDQLKNALSDKIFLGFSDTTMNHLMLHKLGLKTFYGQAFLPDICELDRRMLPYTERYFAELLRTGTIAEIRPSQVWYEGRTDFGESAVGQSMPAHPNDGFVLLQGAPVFTGEILGGCIDSIYDIFSSQRYGDTVSMCGKYGLFPTVADWQGKILLLETSEEQPTPEKYREMLLQLKHTGIFGVLSGILAGKPMDEKYTEEYQKIIVQVADNPALPIVWNLNVGHATPRCIIPFGVPAKVDVAAQRIFFAKDYSF
ncbi:MAG: LD-carboxypeptidase [Oscillospiraceae bacterium]